MCMAEDIQYFERSDYGRHFARVVSASSGDFGREYRFDEGSGWVSLEGSPVFGWLLSGEVYLDEVEAHQVPQKLVLS